MLFIRLLNITINIIHSASILVTICTTMIGLFRVLGFWVVPLANIRYSFCIPSKSKPNPIGIQQAILYHRPHTNHLIYFIRGTHLSTNNIIRCTRKIRFWRSIQKLPFTVFIGDVIACISWIFMVGRDSEPVESTCIMILNLESFELVSHFPWCTFKNLCHGDRKISLFRTKVMLVTVCWWLYIGHQYFKVVTNTYRLQHPSPTFDFKSIDY